MIRISHESPLSLLDASRVYNDYDYALAHLLGNRKYREFFKASLKEGRTVILDNSMFELGEAFDVSEFHEAVQSLMPTEYIIPDVAGNSSETIRNVEKWNHAYRNDLIVKGCRSIGVVQGRTPDELLSCFDYMRDNTDIVAIPFGLSYYEQRFHALPIDWARMYGRMELVDVLIEAGYMRDNTEVHLLGCSLPQELRHYKGERYSFIKSVDTSNPIVHGLKGIRYKDFGLSSKDPMKLVDLLDEEPDAEALADIRYNINLFRKFVKYE